MRCVPVLSVSLLAVLLTACGTTPRKHDAPVVETRTLVLEPPAVLQRLQALESGIGVVEAPRRISHRARR